MDAVRLFPDDSRVLVSTGSTRLAVFDVPSGRELRVLDVPGWYSDFAASPDGRTIAVSYASMELRGFVLLDASTGRAVREEYEAPEDEAPYADAVAFHPGGGILAVARSSATVAFGVPEGSWVEFVTLEG